VDIQTKLKYANQAADSILKHDDVPFDGIEMAAGMMKAHIDAGLEEARKRRLKAAGLVVGKAEE